MRSVRSELPERNIVEYRNSAAVRLRDVARLISSAENTKLAAWMNSTPTLILNVQRQPVANVIDARLRLGISNKISLIIHISRGDEVSEFYIS
jgi:hypothetical protein